MGPHGAEPRAGVPQNKGGHAVPPNPPVLPFLLSKPWGLSFFVFACLFVFVHWLFCEIVHRKPG